MTPALSARLLLVTAWACSAAAVATGQHAPSDEARRLRGVWSYSLVEVEGVRQPDAPFESHKLVISEDGRYSILQGRRITRGWMKVDPNQNPGHYDLEVSEGPAAGRSYRGIYQLAGDRLILCLPLRGEERPTAFLTSPGSGLLLFEFRREPEDVERTLAEIARLEATKPED
jgi:uncharacterized protein (TIGR03067 family)